MTEMGPEGAIRVIRTDLRLPIGYLLAVVTAGAIKITVGPCHPDPLSVVAGVVRVWTPLLSARPCVQDGATKNPKTLVPAQNTQHHVN